MDRDQTESNIIVMPVNATTDISILVESDMRMKGNIDVLDCLLWTVEDYAYQR